jgi:hypothetical protein
VIFYFLFYLSDRYENHLKYVISVNVKLVCAINVCEININYMGLIKDLSQSLSKFAQIQMNNYKG